MGVGDARSQRKRGVAIHLLAVRGGGGLYALGFRIELLANPFGAPLALGYAALPLTLLWVVGVINAMNLIDGLDGLAGGVLTALLVVMRSIRLIGSARWGPGIRGPDSAR